MYYIYLDKKQNKLSIENDLLDYSADMKLLNSTIELENAEAYCRTFLFDSVKESIELMRNSLADFFPVEIKEK